MVYTLRLYLTITTVLPSAFTVSVVASLNVKFVASQLAGFGVLAVAVTSLSVGAVKVTVPKYE